MTAEEELELIKEAIKRLRDHDLFSDGDNDINPFYVFGSIDTLDLLTNIIENKKYNSFFKRLSKWNQHI